MSIIVFEGVLSNFLGSTSEDSKISDISIEGLAFGKGTSFSFNF